MISSCRLFSVLKAVGMVELGSMVTQQTRSAYDDQVYQDHLGSSLPFKPVTCSVGRRRLFQILLVIAGNVETKGGIAGTASLL
jgi:hypothetical protein